MEQWSAQATPGRLFVNISADALVHGVGMVGMAKLGEAVRSCGLNARMLVLEITEHERVTNMPLLREAIDAVHACGARMALDDFGDGRSSLRLWSEVKPDFVKIDKYFIREISDRPENLQMLQAIKGIADVFGTTLIAEGIETRTTCAPCGTWTFPTAGAGCWGGPQPWRVKPSRARPWMCCTTAGWPCCRTWGKPRAPASCAACAWCRPRPSPHHHQ